MRVKAILLATCLVTTVPGAVHAQSAADKDAADKDVTIFLTSAYLECGTYYTFVAACMGEQRDKYVEMGTTLWKRGLTAGTDAKVPPEMLNEKVMAAKDDMVKKTGEKCAKMGALHKTYKQFCKNIYE